jgi:hypothetical protein
VIVVIVVRLAAMAAENISACHVCYIRTAFCLKGEGCQKKEAAISVEAKTSKASGGGAGLAVVEQASSCVGPLKRR